MQLDGAQVNLQRAYFMLAQQPSMASSLDDFFAKKDKRKKGKGKKFVTSEAITKTIEVRTLCSLVSLRLCDAGGFAIKPLNTCCTRTSSGFWLLSNA